MSARALPDGVRARHARSCPALAGGLCACTPRYQARAWVAAEERRVARTFETPAAAEAWLRQARREIAASQPDDPARLTFREAAEQFREDLLEGTARARGGQHYSASTAFMYSQSLKAYAIPHFGDRPLADIRRRDIQAFIDQLDGATSQTTGRPLSPKTVANALHPVRAVFRRALRTEEVSVDPTRDAELPSVRQDPGRMRDPAEVAALLAALPAPWRALYATACYAGLRRGELQALRWSDVDLDAGLIHVKRSFYPRKHLYVPTKTRAGFRQAPIAPTLHAELLKHRDETGRDGDDLVFGRTPAEPFDGTTALRCAKYAWRQAGLEPLGIHEGRHVAASFMIAAGISLHEVSGYLGHASIQITADRYGHLVPGTQARAASRLEAFLSGS